MEAEFKVKIEKGVPLIAKFTRPAGPILVGIRSMEVDDSFEFASEYMKTVQSAKARAMKESDNKFAVRLIADKPGMYRIWRVS